MATLTIRNLPEEVHQGLRQRAAANGRSMEAEARVVLSQVVAPAEGGVEPGDKPVARKPVDWAALQSKARQQMMAANGGVMPQNVVEEWLIEKRKIAAEEHAKYDRLAGLGPKS
jgi:plasmid stability protein